MKTVDTNWELIHAQSQVKALMEIAVKARFDLAVMEKRNNQLQSQIDQMQSQYWHRVNGFLELLRMVAEIVGEEIPEHKRSYELAHTMDTVERTLTIQSTFH